MSKCKIIFNDNENGVYYAGQTLSGIVELYLPGAKYCSGLRLTIDGSAKCKFTMQHGIKKNSHSTTHRGLEQYLDEISYLFGSKDGESMLIEAGVHTYNFSCFLPLDLPCSVIANNGSVRYIVEAYLHVTNEVDGKMDREFTICRKDDLNLYQDLKMPCEKEDMACFCCRLFSCQPLLLEASIPYSGYIPGDTINVAIKVINKSNATVPKCQIELVQKIKYTSEENENKNVSKVMVKVEAQGVEKRKTASFDVELVVPWTLTNTSDMNCNVFQITYEMKVTCRTKGCSIGPGVIFPITLGGVPLSFDDNMSPLTNSSICMPPPSFEQAMDQRLLSI